MSKPQENDLDESTLDNAKEALDFYEEQDKEDSIGLIEEDENLDDDGQEDDTDATKELEGKLQEMEALLKPYGGVEGAARALELVKTNPDYQAVTQRLMNGSDSGGETEDKEEDDPNMSPETKKAIDFVNKLVDKKLGKSLKQVESQIDKKVKPLSESFHQTRLETIEGKMIGTYGEETYKSLEKEMDKVLAEYPSNYLDNPSFKKVDDVFHTALRRAGKAEKFYLQQNQDKIKGKKEKSTGSPGTSGNAQEKVELREIRNGREGIFDALHNAELKASKGSNRENAKARVGSKKFKGGKV